MVFIIAKRTELRIEDIETTSKLKSFNILQDTHSAYENWNMLSFCDLRIWHKIEGDTISLDLSIVKDSQSIAVVRLLPYRSILDIYFSLDELIESGLELLSWNASSVQREDPYFVLLRGEDEDGVLTQLEWYREIPKLA